MPRLTKAELSDHRVWLSDWRTRVDMAAYVFAVNDATGSACRGDTITPRAIHPLRAPVQASQNENACHAGRRAVIMSQPETAGDYLWP